jgi:hypothetical protein
MKKQVSSITVVTCQKCVHARQNKKVKTKEEQNRRQTQNRTTEGLESLWGRDRLIWLQLPNVGLLFPLVSNRWFLEQSIIDLSTRLSLSLSIPLDTWLYNALDLTHFAHFFPKVTLPASMNKNKKLQLKNRYEVLNELIFWLRT